MAKRKQINFIFVFFLICSGSIFANPNLDQWIDTEKTYKDLINEGYQVKSYSVSDIELESGLFLIFVTVLQKDNDIYECHEYQTMDQNLETLDMNLICKQLVQPYQRGVDT